MSKITLLLAGKCPIIIASSAVEVAINWPLITGVLGF